MDQRLEGHAASDIEGADALGGVELVPRDRQEVDPELVDPGPDLADRLSGVGVDKNPSFVSDRGDGSDGLDCADLVVREHDAHQDRPGRDCPANILGVDQAGSIDRNDGHPSTEPLQEPKGLEDRGVLDSRRDDVVAAFPKGEEDPLEGEVVGLAPAAREDDLIGTAAEEFGNLGAGTVEKRSRRTAAGMGRDGLANGPSRRGRMTAATRGSIGVLAL